MVRMGTVWDRTSEVLSGRGGALARIAALGIFLPTVLNAAFKVFVTATSQALPLLLLGAVLAIAVVMVVIWANLAMLALSSDPATTPAAAQSLALRRLAPALGIVVIFVLGFVILLIPPIAVLAAGASNFSPELMQLGVMPSFTPGAMLFFVLYVLALVGVGFFLGARLSVTNAVIVNERLGLGALRRSFQLTRGSAWRIVGVMILYAIVVLVATFAAQSIVGVIFGIALGGKSAPTVVFLASVAAAAVSAVFTAIAAAFVAQLYVALAGWRNGLGLAPIV